MPAMKNRTIVTNEMTPADRMNGMSPVNLMNVPPPALDSARPVALNLMNPVNPVNPVDLMNLANPARCPISEAGGCRSAIRR